MIAKAFLKALDQLFDKSFRKVFFIGIIGAAIVFAGLLAGLIYVMPENLLVSDWEWVNSSLDWIMGFAAYPLFFIVAWLFFPAVATMFMGLFLDDVVDAVEDRHYPDHKSPRRITAYESFMTALKLGLKLILYNLLALPLYVILIFTAIGPFILYLLLNSVLLGREYYELVAMRHLDDDRSKALRRAMRDRVFLTGGVITLLYIVPGVNLFAPLIGAAMMVHIFHGARESGLRP